MLFVQYPPCSTCQKAKRWLDDHGIAYEDRHIKQDNPTFFKCLLHGRSRPMSVFSKEQGHQLRMN